VSTLELATNDKERKGAQPLPRNLSQVIDTLRLRLA
jgi:hypothetical protein